MTQHSTAPVIVPVPDDPAYRNEPSRTIAKAMEVKNAVVAILAATGYIVSPQLDGQIEIVLQAIITVALAAYGWYTAHQQGEETRASVYSPASAAQIARADQADVVPGDPKYAAPPVGDGTGGAYAARQR